MSEVFYDKRLWSIRALKELIAGIQDDKLEVLRFNVQVSNGGFTSDPDVQVEFSAMRKREVT